MLVLLGIGLSASHLSEEARYHLSTAEKVYLDTYTNVLDEEEIAVLESVAGKSFFRASRRDLEDKMGDIIEEARDQTVVVAVSGDPLAATTHAALYLEALKRGVPVRYVPGISIHTVAPSLSGLQHYRFGRTVTVPYLWKNSPSFYEFLAQNRRLGLHSLVLLDLHPEPLKIPDAIEAILHWERKKRLGVLELGDLVIGIARAGKPDCFRFVGTAEELLDVRWGSPPHSLVIPGELHPVEEEFLYVVRKHGGEC
ncbi:MAG: diphthine synthase [Candidatus Diapherotrites archaeon]|nr:diphthine synthase [Candidatus Diapherotrites archaeon]